MYVTEEPDLHSNTAESDDYRGEDLYDPLCQANALDSKGSLS